MCIMDKEVKLHIFFTAAQDGDEWSVSYSSWLYSQGKNPHIHWLWGWVGPRTSLDRGQRQPLLGIEPWLLSPQPVILLSYSCSELIIVLIIILLDYSIQAWVEENFRKTTEETTWNLNRIHGLICDLMVVIIIILLISS